MYAAANFSIRFDTLEKRSPDSDSMRPLGIGIRSLGEAEAKLIESGISFVRQRSISPGYESLLLQDPAGNWLELIEIRPV